MVEDWGIIHNSMRLACATPPTAEIEQIVVLWIYYSAMGDISVQWPHNPVWQVQVETILHGARDLHVRRLQYLNFDLLVFSGASVMNIAFGPGPHTCHSILWMRLGNIAWPWLHNQGLVLYPLTINSYCYVVIETIVVCLMYEHHLMTCTVIIALF